MKLLIGFLLIISAEVFSSSKNSDTLYIPIREIPSLDPHLGNGVDSNKVMNQIYRSLVELDKNLDPRPAIAKGWKIDFKKKSIIFKLDPDILFTNGESIKVSDVLRSLKLSKKNGSDIISQVKSFEQINSLTFKVFLKDSNFKYFLRKLASVEGSIFKKVGEKFVGTGRYKINSIEKDKIILSRVDKNSFYKFITFEKASSRVIKGSKYSQVDEMSFRKLKLDEDLYKTQVSSQITYGLIFNVRNGIFKSKNVRKALSLAIDKQEFLKRSGRNGVLASGLIPKGYPGYKKYTSNYNPNEARKLLKNKSYDFSFGLTKKNKGKVDFIEKYLVNELSKIGLKMKVKYFDSFKNLLKSFRAGGVNLIIKGDGPRYYEPVTSFLFYVKGQKMNVSGFESNEISKLYYKYEKLNNNSDKLEVLDRLSEVVSSEVPVVPLFHSISKTWYRKNITGDNMEKLTIRSWDFPYYSYSPKSTRRSL